MKASAVLRNAKTELGNLIITYLRKLVGFEQTGKKNLMAQSGDMEIDATRFAKTPYINVEVNDAYTDMQVVTKSVENLARIAEALEKEYESR